MYTGTEPIIFDKKPVPSHLKGFASMNHHDMRGTIVEANKSISDKVEGGIYPISKITEGMRGIVYEIYKDLDDPDQYGWSIIFENGDYDGFSYEDREKHCVIELIGIFPPAKRYRFSNVFDLNSYFKAGKFKFR